MRLTCSCCGATESLDSRLAAAAAKDFALEALRAPDALSERLYRYLGLFRPRQRALSWVRAAKLLAELNDDIAAGQIKRDGCVWPAPMGYWQQALDATLDARPRLVLPLKDHGYLYAIIAGISSGAAARAEEAEEVRRRRREGPRTGGMQGAAALVQTVAAQAGVASAAQAEKPIPEPRAPRVPPPNQFRALAERLKGKQETGETT